MGETTDIRQRCVANFVCGILGTEEKKRKILYLINLKMLQKVNHLTTAEFFNDSLSILWPEEIYYDCVLGAVTAAALYLCKCMAGL